MVHRAPDSRLLANLVSHEKDYAKHLAALFPLSLTALASLSAYAAASPNVPPEASPAQVIAAVVDVFAAADDALQRYTHSLDAWREQLVSLKDLEDDLAAVLRDRDILVTRLIKASKATRDARRSSKLVPPLANLGSASFSSLPSTNTSYTTASTVSNPAATNTKLAQAQAELQACEAHLVIKERELDARRISVAREGLGARCRALIDCGWVWGEMGKQGLRTLQALSADIHDTAPSVPPKVVRPSLSTSVIPSFPPYASDDSSVTPSQSASQTAVRSAPTSQESQPSKELPEAEIETPRPSAQRRTTHTEEHVDLTITLPPAHSISDLALPTLWSHPQDQPSNFKPTPVVVPPPVPRRRRTARARRPPSQHILEVSDEGSDRPSSNDHNAPSPHSRTPFPTSPISSGSHDTSSDEDVAAIGPFEVVENNPFDVIRQSIIGPSPSLSLIPTVPSPSSPTASASVPDVRIYDTPLKAGTSFQNTRSANPSETASNPSPSKRERRTSMAFFGSLRGLFRKPKERDRVVTEWDAHASPNASTTHLNGKPGWVTRTDARIKGRAEDSEDDPMPAPTQASRVNPPIVGRQLSGARLRKGRPGATRAPEHAKPAASMDGWITDNPGPNGGATTGLDRSRTRRAAMKRRKISVADLRGSEQGHTDGEVDRRASLERVPSSKGIARVPEGFVSATVSRRPEVVQVTEKELPRQGSRLNGVAGGANRTESNASVGIQRSTTTIALSGHKPPDKATHRRSASLSLTHAHMTSTSLPSLNQGARTPSSGSSSGSMSWRKPPPQLELPSQTHSRSRTPSPPKAPAPTRRPTGNGHAHTPSLMSIVADVVTCQQENGDRARSMDIPRAPGSVLREAGNAKRASLTMVGESTQPRVPKMPLRSALRNPSRTPSPVPVVVGPLPAPAEERVASPLSLKDSASVSSYETGRESLNGDDRGVLSPQSRSPSVPRSGSPARSSHTPPIPPPSFSFPPPPVEPPPVANADPSSSVSTETPPVTRRKSVRVSLQPTFSPTPPALCDDDGEGYAPWTASFSTREAERGRARARLEGASVERRKREEREDVWVDSSDEDEAYSQARALLSGKGKGRVKA